MVLAQLLLSGCGSIRPEAPAATTAPAIGTTPNVGPIKGTSTGPAEAPTQAILPTQRETPQPGLPFDQFITQAFARILQNDPEWATAEGIADQVGADETLLTDISVDGIRRTYALQRELLDQVRAYSTTSFSRQQRLTYKAFEWYLDDLVRGQQFSANDYPINQLPLLSVNYLTEYLFTDQQSISDEEEARAYIARLGQVGKKFDDLLAGLERREQAGIIAPRRVLDAAIGDIQIIANSTPEQTPYYTALMEKMAPLSDIPPAVQQDLLLTAEQEIETTVLPAYQRLADFLASQRKRAPLNDGLWQYPQGEAYYRYLLRHHTTTELTPDEIHQQGLDELARLQTEMRQRFDQLGYPKEAGINDLYVRVSNESGIVAGGRVLQTYEELISQAESRLSEAFEIHPIAELEVRSFPEGMAFYTAAPLDSSRPGIFYAPVGNDLPRYQLPTLAYHEALPGHHFQISLAREQNLPLFRNVVVFGAYTEGWGMYAEHLAGELGWYKDDIYGDLGRLQSEALRAARLGVDTGLHAKGWTYDQAVNFLVENTGLPYQQMAYEVTRYIAWPGQATSYEVGLLKLLELRKTAQDRLGERFDLKAFHSAILQAGSLPLPVLENVVDDYSTLASLDKITPDGAQLPFYTLHYAGDYDFEAHILQNGTAWDVSPSRSWACSTFTSQNTQGERLFARNFDWYQHPAMLLFTDPPDGYASATMVDLSYLGFDGQIEPGDALDPLLRAPMLPFDGVNERGLAVGMMAVPHGEGGNDPNKMTLDSLEIIRLLLDKAARVDEALSLFGQYNIDWGSGPPVHYLIADAAGDSAVVELIDGKMVVTRSQQPWQVSTNFLFSETPLEQADEVCWRYAAAQTALAEAEGVLSEPEAMALLQKISQPGATATIWSVVYNLTNGKIRTAVGRDYQRVYHFSLSGE